MEIKIATHTESIEALSALLIEHGASGVAIEDPKDIIHFQKDNYGEVLDLSEFDLNKEPLVIGYFPESIFSPELVMLLKEQLHLFSSYGLKSGSKQITINEVKEANWEKAWKKYYHPVRISRYLTVVPDWENYTPLTSEEKLITLDPGMAFGTGTHPTTKLSLQALEMTIKGGETVYDVGTGSGVLSIAAKLFGAKEITAFDLDDVAVKKAQENLVLNHMQSDVQVKKNNLLKGISKPVDLILANILADIIIELIPMAKSLLKKEGTMILSGIILDKKEEVKKALEKESFCIKETLNIGDWLGFIVTHKGNE